MNIVLMPFGIATGLAAALMLDGVTLVDFDLGRCELISRGRERDLANHLVVGRRGI